MPHMTPPTKTTTEDPHAFSAPKSAQLEAVFDWIGRDLATGRVFVRSSSRQAGNVLARAVAALLLEHLGWSLRDIGKALARSPSAIARLKDEHRHQFAAKRSMQRALSDSALRNSTPVYQSPLPSVDWPSDLRHPTPEQVRDAALRLAGLQPGAWPNAKRRNTRQMAALAAAMPWLAGPLRMSQNQIGSLIGMARHITDGCPAWALAKTPAGIALAAALRGPLLNLVKGRLDVTA